MSHQMSAQLDIRGTVLRFLEGAIYLTLLQNIRGLPSLPFMGNGGGALNQGGRVERPGLEDDHPCLPSAEAKNEWSYTPTPLYAFVACTLYCTLTFVFIVT
jgi:hypothetical protein